MAVFVIASLPVSVSAAQPSGLPHGASDITKTTQGARLIKEAKARPAFRGFSGEFKAIKDEAGITIAPADAQLVPMTVTLESGASATALVPITAPAPNLKVAASADAQALTASPTWNFQLQQCFARISDTWSYIDHCYALYKMANDGDATRDYFALQHYSTAGPNSPWVLNWAKIQGVAFGPAQTWMDWSPKADFNGNCQTVNLGVTVKAVGLTLAVDRCDIWDMTKQNPAVNYNIVYFSPGQRNDRELSFEIAVSVAQGAWPQWSIPAETHGGPF
jgi:hypothetical protein